MNDLVRGLKIQTGFNTGVAPSIVNGDFLNCFLEGNELLVFVEPQHIQPVLPFHTSVMFRCAGTNPPIFDAKLYKRQFETSGFFYLLPEQGIGELVSVVGLSCADLERRGFDGITQEKA